MPTVLTQISPASWEHPADRAALRALRALPGFEEVVRSIAGTFGERGVRNLFLGDAVLVGPTQRPRLHALHTEVLTTLDWSATGRPAPQLYVTQTPIANAGAVGFDQPFIVVSSGTLDLLTPEEQRFVLAQQVGHILAGRTTYRTIALIVLAFGLRALPPLASVALLPFQLALLDWYRTSELSADRAGMLGTQAPRASLMTFLKLAGGRAEHDTIDLDAYLAQAAEYDLGGTAWDRVLRALNTALREHPFHTVRAGELHRWEQSGAYAEIVAGRYIRRGSETERPYRDDLRDATVYYAEKARAAADTVGDALTRAAGAFRDAYRTASARAAEPATADPSAAGRSGPPPERSPSALD